MTVVKINFLYVQDSLRKTVDVASIFAGLNRATRYDLYERSEGSTLLCKRFAGEAAYTTRVKE